MRVRVRPAAMVELPVGVNVAVVADAAIAGVYISQAGERSPAAQAADVSAGLSAALDGLVVPAPRPVHAA